MVRVVVVGPYPLVARRHPTITRLLPGFCAHRRSRLACSGGVITPGQIWLSLAGSGRSAGRPRCDDH
ncbi:hypothetical protein D7044_21770 [Micromonospora musae]|uniref:Uncharacterized protein n=1 Tax=Micromonospora musae TaxID=1894970 RepID=A0A3A9XW37_9ACTN|nr:hypothetical protein D7044_21770 [Micromonospora musae]